MMTYEILRRESEKTFQRMIQHPSFKRFLSAKISLTHYKSVLRQIYFYSREFPQMMTMATAFFRGPERNLIKAMTKHATSLIGYDELALNDLRVLGEDTEILPFEYPLPATDALISHVYHQIQHRDPIGTLGIIFFLEYLPNVAGKTFLKVLTQLGVPENGMSFARGKSAVDSGHTQLAQTYIGQLVKSKTQLSAVIFGIKVSAYLYTQVIDQAFSATDDVLDFGVDGIEIQRSFPDRFDEKFDEIEALHQRWLTNYPRTATTIFKELAV